MGNYSKSDSQQLTINLSLIVSNWHLQLQGHDHDLSGAQLSYAPRMWGHGKVIPRCQIQSHTSTLPLYQLKLQLELAWIYLNTQHKLYFKVFNGGEVASNEIHFRSKVRTVKAATCPKILCCAPCAHREQLPQLRPWQYCDLVHTTHKTQHDPVLLCLAT